MSREIRRLPAATRARADKQFALLKANPQHPSLHFKKLGDRQGREIWSPQVSLKYRAVDHDLGRVYLVLDWRA
jgi:hypothetical protein